MFKSLIQQSVQFVPWRVRGWIKHIPGLAAMQRFVLRKVIEGQEFAFVISAGPAKGLMYPVVLPDDKGVWTGSYEVEFVTALVGSVKPGDICFDIGGWRGYCGGAMSTHQAKGVYIFEPLPDNCARIERLLSLNTNLPIQLVKTAVGAADGNATFSMLDATSMGKLSDSPFQPEVKSEKSIDVTVISLDSWRRRNGIDAPNVMKIDVEGAELMVLQGAAETIKESHPTMFIECHSRELTKQVCEYLAPVGYAFKTLETNAAPDGKSEPEVCHLVAQFQ
jgi:FkbM family methyltransferase